MGNPPPEVANAEAHTLAEEAERDVPQRDTLEFRADDLFRLQTTAGENREPADPDAMEDRDTVEIPNLLAVELVVESAATSRPTGAMPATESPAVPVTAAQLTDGTSRETLSAEDDGAEDSDLAQNSDGAEDSADARRTIPARPAGT